MMSVASDPLFATNQTDIGLWGHIVEVYNEEKKPTDAEERSDDQLRKKWGRIRTAVRKFGGIYHNNLRQPDSGRSQSDIRDLSIRMYNQTNPWFTYLDEYELLQTCPKFTELEEQAAADEDDGLPKRMRLGVAGNYNSSGVGSAPDFDLNDEVEEEPTVD